MPLDPENERRAVSLRNRIPASWRAGGGPPMDDAAFASQLAEMWAIERLNGRADEERREEQARQRAFVQGQVCAFVADGCSQAEAARRAGVRPETVGRWRRQDAAFAEAITAARDGRPSAGQTPRGRPSKLTEKRQQVILRALRQGSARAHAASAAEVSRQTFYSWLRRFPEFRDAVLNAEAEATG